MGSDPMDAQERISAIENGLTRDIDVEKRGLMSMSVSFGRAFGRIKNRDRDSSEMIAEMSARHVRAEELSREIAALHQKMDALLTEVEESNNHVKEANSKGEDLIEEFDNKCQQVRANLTSCENSYVELNRALQNVQTKADEVSNLIENSSESAEEIDKLHSQLFGYEKEDGTFVEGKKKKLDNVYGDLEQRAEDMRASMQKFERECQQACQETVNHAKEDLEVVKTTLEGLLPQALTAGLSAAYQENRAAEENEHKRHMALFVTCIKVMVWLAVIPVTINFVQWVVGDVSFNAILARLPRIMLLILPFYAPLFWLAIFANKRVNLSKRLIEEYKHKEAVSKTYEGLAKQISIIEDKSISAELQARLLYNTVALSEKNPGELIKNYNQPDNPLIDVLRESTKFSEAMERLANVPGFSKIVSAIASRHAKKTEALEDGLENSVNATN